MKRISFLFGVLIAASAVVGCAAVATASAPSSSPTAEPTPKRTPTPTPTPEVPEADAIVVSLEGFDILDESGDVLFSHVWANEAAPVVEELSEIFESVPVLSEREGNSHNAPYTEYTWPGFQFSDAITDKPRDLIGAATTVKVTGAEVNGIEIMTDAGFGVGTTLDELAAAGIDVAYPEDLWLDAIGECCTYMWGEGSSTTGTMTMFISPLISF